MSFKKLVLLISIFASPLTYANVGSYINFHNESPYSLVKISEKKGGMNQWELARVIKSNAFISNAFQFSPSLRDVTADGYAETTYEVNCTKYNKPLKDIVSIGVTATTERDDLSPFSLYDLKFYVFQATHFCVKVDPPGIIELTPPLKKSIDVIIQNS